MRPNEQLSWALVTISVIALPKWALSLALLFRLEVLSQVVPHVPAMILVAGICSLLLLDLSQPLSALFALVAAGYATPVLSAGGYAVERYTVSVFLPAVMWVIAATYPNAGSKWARRTALGVSAFSLALFLSLALGLEPFFWPALLEAEFRSWEWATPMTLLALIVIRIRTGRFRLPVAKAKVMLRAFGPALAVLLLEVLAQLTAKVWGYESPPELSRLLVLAANLALGWGIFTLTRAEFARRKEIEHAANRRDPFRS